MKRILVSLLALWFGYVPAHAGSMLLLGAGSVTATTGGPSYTFVGTACTPASGSTLTSSQNIGTLSATKLVIVAASYQINAAVSSITVGGVSLGSKVAGQNQAEIWANTISSLSGAQSIVVTWASGSFDERCLWVWTADGLNSNTVKNTGSSATNTATINITSGDFLFGVAETTGGTSTWGTSTQAPTNIHNSGVTAGGSAADWITSVTNASFAGNPGAGQGPTGLASWR